MLRFLLIFSLLFVPGIARAQEAGEHLLSVRDVIELTKAGIGEEALVALIEVNQRIFPVDVDTLKTLKDAGVAQSVIVAMIRSGRTAPPASATTPMDLTAVPVQPVDPAQPAPPVVVVEHHHEEPVVREVPVPVYVAVPVRRIDRRGDHHVPRTPKVEPVYWGWGGKLRPDAWKPVVELQKDAKIPLQPQRK